MKISKSQLKQIIKEELFRLMEDEDWDDPTTMTGRWTDTGPVYKCEELKAELDAAQEADSKRNVHSDEWHTQAALSSAEAAWRDAGCDKQGK